MKVYNYPPPEEWNELTQRPKLVQSDLEESVKDIMMKVRTNGDDALRDFTKEYDGVDLVNLKVSEEAINEAAISVSQELKDAISVAVKNIGTFHMSQLQQIEIIETMPGVRCWSRQVPIEKVGLYIPGGSAPLFSSLLMLGIPAMLAGCNEVVICTPPDKNGNVHPTILFVAGLMGMRNVFKVGGAHAIAAMAFGTESVPKVNKIFGPGNQFVTKAKELGQQYGAAIDIPAGPSEVLVIADMNSNPKFVAADLLSQAEHGPDSQVILLSDDKWVVDNCIKEVEAQLKFLPRKDIAALALNNSKAIVLNDLETCIAYSNLYAPEHLILATKNPEELAAKVYNAGSVFLGNFSCESVGDYASGTNHTLPTNGNARAYSGVSLDSFMKKITFQKVSEEGIQNIGPTVEVMAEAEGLWAHKNAVSLRLEALGIINPR